MRLIKLTAPTNTKTDQYNDMQALLETEIILHCYLILYQLIFVIYEIENLTWH